MARGDGSDEKQEVVEAIEPRACVPACMPHACKGCAWMSERMNELVIS